MTRPKLGQRPRGKNEKHLGGWIGVSANLELNAKLNAEANATYATHLIQHTSVAEFPVKGSGLTPLDSPRMDWGAMWSSCD